MWHGWAVFATVVHQGCVSTREIRWMQRLICIFDTGGRRWALFTVSRTDQSSFVGGQPEGMGTDLQLLHQQILLSDWKLLIYVCQDITACFNSLTVFDCHLIVLSWSSHLTAFSFPTSALEVLRSCNLFMDCSLGSLCCTVLCLGVVQELTKFT